MTEPNDSELLALAVPYVLHAVSDIERAQIERQLHTVSADVFRAFHAEVRGVRETMTKVAAATAADPPPGLRDRVLAVVGAQARRRLRWRVAGSVAAAALAVAVAFGAGLAFRPTPPPTTATEAVVSASDVRAASAQIPAGGTATVVYSRQQNAAVLVMTNVAPPAAGTVYQLWLIEDQRPTSAGTMNAQAVTPSTTDVIDGLGDASVLAFTVEPGGGSDQPTAEPFAALPLG